MLFALITKAQDFSNKGKDFWIPYANHVRMYNSDARQQESMALYITSDVNTSGTVTINGIGSTNFTVTANQITEIPIDKRARLTNDGISNYGIHVTSEKPVVVYSHIYAQNVSGATVCLPTNTLGKEYYSINYKQLSNENPAYSFFVVIATEDNTTVEITPASGTVAGWPAGSTQSVTLNKGQLYQVLANSDLTGSTIKSIANATGTCKRIAVFSGSGKVYIHTNENLGCNSSDNLYQQIYPTNTWGKKYITVPSSRRPLNIYRVIKSEPSAQVYVNGSLIPAGSFVNNLYYEFSNKTTNVIESDKPIMVAQYFPTQSCGGTADLPNDPEMIFINPVEQTIDHVTLNSTNHYLIKDHYINIVVKNAGTALSSMMLDGNSISSSFSPLPEDQNYSYAQVSVNAGTHNLVCDSGFNAIAYGMGDYETYGYSAGTNLKDLYQYMAIKNTHAVIEFPAACKGSPFIFYNIFPYQPLSIQYKFKGLFNDTTVNNPVYDSTWVVNNRTLYRYKLNRYYTVAQPGTYPITLIVNNPTATDGCSGEQEIDYDLEVFDKPKADFNVDFTGCLNDKITFTAKTDPNNTRKIVATNWDVDNGILLNTTNPSYTYKAIGDSVVKYFYVTDIGCMSDTAVKTISVNPVPKAKFSTSLPACETKAVTFTDQSTIAKGNVTKWHWSFGDNSDSLFTGSPAHAYTKAGSYDVTLMAESDKGCRSSVLTQPIIVHDQPFANFGVPKACIDDYYAYFTDSSHIANGSLIYNWDLNYNSGTPYLYNLKDAQWHYTSIGNYQAKLTVTSDKGCIADTVKSFAINGAMKEAKFTLDNTDLCSNQLLTITNTSEVFFGDIVKLEIWWDYLNDPAIKTTDDNPHKGKKYSHLYGSFINPSGTKPFEIYYKAYSGTACIDDYNSTVILKQSPQLAFDSIPQVCQEALPFTLNSAWDINNFLGTGAYTGTGIAANNTFDPQKAGPGTFPITYTYYADNGCKADSTRYITVNPTPVINVPPTVLSLEGGSTILRATAAGKNLTYEWVPNSFIDNNRILTPAISPSDNTTYTLTATSSDGCKASANVYVKVLKYIKVPNAFSPNGDGIYDTWIITSLADYPGCEVEVYNRYGQIVFRSNGYEKPWDGSYNGYILPVGTYYWIIKPHNGRQPINGSVTIIR